MKNTNFCVESLDTYTLKIFKSGSESTSCGIDHFRPKMSSGIMFRAKKARRQMLDNTPIDCVFELKGLCMKGD